jgi:hypothetical protein
MKTVLYCVLTFIQSTTSLLSLCISSYGLAYTIGKPWMWDHVIVVSCICATILCNAFRQSFDKLFLENYIIDNHHIIEERHQEDLVHDSNLRPNNAQAYYESRPITRTRKTGNNCIQRYEGQQHPQHVQNPFGRQEDHTHDTPQFSEIQIT